MTDKQRLFVDAYLGKANCNATKAAEIAGYEDPGQSGWEAKHTPEIAAEIEGRMAQNAMSAGEVLNRLADMARGPGAYVEAFTEYTLSVNVEQLIADGKGHLIKGVKWTGAGQQIVEFHDSQAALIQIGRHLKLFTDKIEHDFTGLSDEQLEREIESLAGGEAPEAEAQAADAQS